MNRPERRADGLFQRIVTIGGIVALMVIVLLSLTDDLVSPRAATDPATVDRIMKPVRTVPAEADVFRIRAADLAMDPSSERRPDAQPRNLSLHRGLRAFPGAPPRITHGLESQELRSPDCNACHVQGGYSPRFGAYVPVTPHPELEGCLQCHVPDGELVGIGFPDPVPGAVCYQCHTTVEDRSMTFVSLDWPEPDWPDIGQRAAEGSPPWIPHDLHFRGNCLACHGGPGAVAEIRTDHPEWANCRQCHVPGPPSDGDVYTYGGDRTTGEQP